MGTFITPGLAVALFTTLGLVITSVAIARDVGLRRLRDGPVMTLAVAPVTLPS